MRAVGFTSWAHGSLLRLPTIKLDPLFGAKFITILLLKQGAKKNICTKNK
jgi:hypothetical protein